MIMAVFFFLFVCLWGGIFFLFDFVFFNVCMKFSV